MEKKYAIGLMSGTSADGMDAALVSISGCSINTVVELVDFVSIEYREDFRNELLRLAKGNEGGSRDLSRMNFALGDEMKKACSILLDKSGINKKDIAFVGSHGHTFYHEPNSVNYVGHTVRSTFQLGESAVVSSYLGCPVVSDFRVSDLAHGGQGAPLVPYTEYILYGHKNVNYGLLNIGGIANITLIGKDFDLSDVIAFDTGPGNMVLDNLVSRFSSFSMRYDKNGDWAKKGRVNDKLLSFLLDDPYLKKEPPKTTGREYYGEEYINRLLKMAEGISKEDILRTVTALTAECVNIAINSFFPFKPEEILVGGGGASNSTMMEELNKRTGILSVKNEFSDAKEAIAFAILANERLNNIPNNAPRSTGANEPVVMGKVVL